MLKFHGIKSKHRQRSYSQYARYNNKKQTRENIYTDGRGNICEQKCRAKRNIKEYKIQKFKYRDKRNGEHEIYDYSGNYWSHWDNKKWLKEKLGSRIWKRFQ
jgi:hypothetical protein